MENNMETLKTEIADWLESLEDESVLLEILRIKNRMEVPQVAEETAAYPVKDEFDERLADGIPVEEMTRRTHAYIESLPCEK